MHDLIEKLRLWLFPEEELPEGGHHGADIWCPAGFKCVSKVEDFGLGHDGRYPHMPPVITSDPRLRDAYEVGCPARGTASQDGMCLDDGRNGRTKCFSPHRYEGGPGSPCGEAGSNLCRCIRLPPRPRGNAALRQVSDGVEVLMGEFEESVPHGCGNCNRLSEDEAACKACYPACVLMEEVEHKNGMGGMAGEMIPKCRSQAEAMKGAPPDSELTEGRPFNHGFEAVKDVGLKVIPHYKMWYPEEPDDKTEESDGGAEEPKKEESEDMETLENVKMPYAVRRDPMGRLEWIKMWKKAAPRVQNVLDGMVTKMENEWSQPGRFDTCWSDDKKGDDISGKIERFLAVQRSCREMNDVASTIRGEGKEGNIRFDSGLCGKADPRGLCGCIRAVDEEGEAIEAPEDCQFLNCYSSGDKKLDDALAAVQDKESTCQAHVSSVPFVALVAALSWSPPWPRRGSATAGIREFI